MNNYEKNNSLVPVNEQGIFKKIKSFFKKIFGLEEEIAYSNIKQAEEKTVNVANKPTFSETIRIVEDEETKILKLQKQYRSGKIKESEMSEEQINSLCDLYDKQIERLKKSNERRKEKLLLYRKRMQASN